MNYLHGIVAANNVTLFQEHLDVRVARIFNTYGPRMHMYDGGWGLEKKWRDV